MKVRCIKNTKEKEGWFTEKQVRKVPLIIGKIYDVEIAYFDNIAEDFVVYDENNEWTRYSPEYFEGNIL